MDVNATYVNIMNIMTKNVQRNERKNEKCKTQNDDIID